MTNPTHEWTDNRPKAARAYLLNQLNLREGDTYEVTIDGQVLNVRITEIIWNGLEIEALRMDQKSHMSVGDKIVVTTTVTVIPWMSVNSIVWHEHWQHGYQEESDGKAGEE